MNKIKTTIAASALAAAGVTGVVSSSASAICGVALEEHNVHTATASIDWANSDVRLRVGGIPGPWLALGAGSTSLAPGDITAQAFTVNGACGRERQYRLLVTSGASSWFEYYPSAATWTLDLSPHIHLLP